MAAANSNGDRLHPQFAITDKLAWQRPEFIPKGGEERLREEGAGGESHFIIVDADEEEKGGVAPVHDLVVPVLHERTLHQHKKPAGVSENQKCRKKNLSRSRSKTVQHKTSRFVDPERRAMIDPSGSGGAKERRGRGEEGRPGVRRRRRRRCGRRDGPAGRCGRGTCGRSRPRGRVARRGRGARSTAPATSGPACSRTARRRGARRGSRGGRGGRGAWG